MTRWLSDFLVGRVIQVNVNGFLSNQINSKPQLGSVLSPLLFLIYVNNLPTPHHKQNSLFQFADDTTQWDFSLTVCFAAKLLQQDLLNFDDLISFKKKINEFISDIYPKELTISETTESTSVASYLDDLLFTTDENNNITTKLYDKRDTFGFHIVSFAFMSSNIPSAPAYCVYASQLIRYARCCSNYSDFLSRHRVLVTRLLLQGYKINRLSNTFKKFYSRHTDLFGQYKKNVCEIWEYL